VRRRSWFAKSSILDRICAELYVCCLSLADLQPQNQHHSKSPFGRVYNGVIPPGSAWVDEVN
jgi:hypothetical protein